MRWRASLPEEADGAADLTATSSAAVPSHHGTATGDSAVPESSDGTEFHREPAPTPLGQHSVTSSGESASPSGASEGIGASSIDSGPSSKKPGRGQASESQSPSSGEGHSDEGGPESQAPVGSSEQASPESMSTMFPSMLGAMSMAGGSALISPNFPTPQFALSSSGVTGLPSYPVSGSAAPTAAPDPVSKHKKLKYFRPFGTGPSPGPSLGNFNHGDRSRDNLGREEDFDRGEHSEKSEQRLSGIGYGGQSHTLPLSVTNVDNSSNIPNFHGVYGGPNGDSADGHEWNAHGSNGARMQDSVASSLPNFASEGSSSSGHATTPLTAPPIATSSTPIFQFTSNSKSSVSTLGIDSTSSISPHSAAALSFGAGFGVGSAPNVAFGTGTAQNIDPLSAAAGAPFLGLGTPMPPTNSLATPPSAGLTTNLTPSGISPTGPIHPVGMPANLTGTDASTSIGITSGNVVNPPAWQPQTHTSTCEFTHTITDYAQKRDSGCKKAEYSNTTVDSHGNKWRLIIYVNGNGRASNHHLSLFLQVADAEELPFGWNKAVSYVLTLEHPHGPSLGYAKRNPDKTFKLCPKAIDWGWSQFITSDRIQQEGYVHNNSLTVRASVTVKSSSVNIDPEDAELYLKCAVEEGNPDAVRSCLAQDARVNCQFKDDLYTPLHTACSANGESNNGNGSNGSGNGSNNGSPGPISPGSLEVLHLLLERGADVNACNKWRETPLLIAANNGHVEAVKALLDAGADPSLCSEAGWSALTFAAHKGYEDIVGLLLAALAPVNCRVTEDLSTPLHKACAGGKPGHLSAVTQLLEGGADVHALNKWRETPLLTAANHGQSAAVEALLRHGADPCKCTDTGWSPLSIAAYKGHDEVVRLLLEEGAPTEEADPTLSALLQAATKGLPDTVMLLLRHGADHTVTTKKGDTALAILVEQNLIDAAVEMVTDYNASVPRCSRDRKKVQRARLLINLRLKQMQREGSGHRGMSDDSDHGESDAEPENGTGALHDAGGSAASPLTSTGSKKKKKAVASSIAKAEADARAAEEALLLEIEAEEKEKTAASEGGKNNKKKKKKKERDRLLKAEKAKEEEREAKLKEESSLPKSVVSPVKKEKVVELHSNSLPAKKTKDNFVQPQPKQKKKDFHSTQNKEVSLPSQSSHAKKQAESRSSLKWGETSDSKQKGGADRFLAPERREKSETKFIKAREVSLPKPDTVKKETSSNSNTNHSRNARTIPSKGSASASKKFTAVAENPKLSAQQSRQNPLPTLQPKTTNSPAQRKRGWESKAVQAAAAPAIATSQPKSHLSKPQPQTTQSVKDSKASISNSTTITGFNSSPSVKPPSTNLKSFSPPNKGKSRSDEKVLSVVTGVSAAPGHKAKLSNAPVAPQNLIQANIDLKPSLDDQLANMANDVLGFLDFDTQTPNNPTSFQDYAMGSSESSDGFQSLPGLSSVHKSSTTPPPSGIRGTMPLPPVIGESPISEKARVVPSHGSSILPSFSVELPAVSLFRLEKLHELFQQCAEARSSPSHPLRVIDEQTLRSVLYRWIIRASHGSVPFMDPVIPSWNDEDYLTEFLQRQFISENRRSMEEKRFNLNVLSIEVLREAGSAMSDLCLSLAKDIVQFRSKCEQQVPSNWSDIDINMSAVEEVGVVAVDWSGRSRVSVPFSVYSSLSKRYVGDRSRLLSTVFSAARRHEIIAAIADQTNMMYRLPPQTMDCLSKGLSTGIETWSDSFSVYGNNLFCATFPDVDAAFGGLAPFGKENGGGESILMSRGGGSVVVITPPENATSSQYIRKMIDLMEGSPNTPLSFSVILSSDCFVNANTALSVDDIMTLDPRLCDEHNGFISFVEIFPAGSSSFSKTNSMFILMQNETGKLHFPPHPSVMDAIRRSMRSDMGIRNNIPIVSALPGVSSDPRYDPSAFPPMPQPQYAGAHDLPFSATPFSLTGGMNRGRGHRGRLFELVGGEDPEEDHGINILPEMLDSLNVSMFSNNTYDDVDIEAISLMGISGHALNGATSNHHKP